MTHFYNILAYQVTPISSCIEIPETFNMYLGFAVVLILTQYSGLESQARAMDQTISYLLA